MHDPREPHYALIKRILRYLHGTLDHGLQLRRTDVSNLVAYSDADWVGCPDTRRSTSGYAVFLGNNLVSWSSKRQPTVSHSSAEAEYRAVANAVAEMTWLRQLLQELHIPLQRATIVFCDNISAVYFSTNPVQHQHTKHIEIDLHFVRERVAAGAVRVLHVPTSSQYADIFTKGLPLSIFTEFSRSNPPELSWAVEHPPSSSSRVNSPVKHSDLPPKPFPSPRPLLQPHHAVARRRLAVPVAALLFLFTASASAANFTCAARAACQSAIGYAVPNATTYAELVSRFNTTTLRDLLGANGKCAPVKLILHMLQLTHANRIMALTILRFQVYEFRDLVLTACGISVHLVCHSSISSTSADHNLLVPNGTYAFTAQDCIHCSCSTSYQLNCTAVQGNGCPTVPPCYGGLKLGQTNGTGCGSAMCAYSGYSNITPLSIQTTLVANQTVCQRGGAARSEFAGSMWRMSVLSFHMVLILICSSFDVRG
ncbi:uncharacterized protein LOC133912813 [Phragmites australis]|uniref:uncharacterized protein LOC133912813 n=1 Tax=Phragmites australis TaxID=29695 RepID=UPI002D76B896|nr:uncharacterized protein LOC133912813 [Phragmites australis]